MKIVVAGALANKPSYGGEAWVRLAWVRGLRSLGAEVLFVEELDPAVTGVGDDPAALSSSPHVAFFDAVSRRWGLAEGASLITPQGEHLAGLPLGAVMDFAAGADLLVNISGHLSYRPVFRGVRRRAYVDLDPGFTQYWHAAGETGLRLHQHEVHFTVGENVGTPGCPIPTSGIRWLPLRQPVVLEDWPAVEPPEQLRFTTLASWRGSYGPVEADGHVFGLKVHEFRRFARLAEEVGVLVEVALDIHPDDDRDRRMLQGHGWKLVDPKRVAATPEEFRDYVRGSGAELSVAQGIYVDTRSGWFSDRSARYLATGRPVVVQDTGFGRRIPVGEGLLSFQDVRSAARAAEDVVRDYERHRMAARHIAQEYFDARKVLSGFLERALVTGTHAAPAAPSGAGGDVHSGNGAPSHDPKGPEQARRAPGNGTVSGRRRVIVSGMVAGVPGQGGATWAVLQYVLGLLRMGHDVHLVEELGTDRIRPPGARLERSENARYFRRLVQRFGLEGRATLLLENSRQTVGLSCADLERVADRAELLLNLSGVLSPRLASRIPVRAYVDLDPAFTQLWQDVEGVDMGLDGHTHFVTVGLALGTSACSVPTLGRQWIRTAPPVVLEEWPAARAQPARDAWTTVANWRGYGSIRWNGSTLGQKAHAFRRLVDLPRESGDRFELALSIHPEETKDLRALRENRWSLVDPGRVAGDPVRYRRFVQGSAAELGVAKTGYVQSRSGWFSDRSACYLASGRPVLAQDTGFSDHLPTGWGLVPFTSLEEAVDGVHRVRADYERHARAARGVAEEHLAADRVLERLMGELGG